MTHTETLTIGPAKEPGKEDDSERINVGSSWGGLGYDQRRSLEDIAEGYLENLIGRNLVMVTQRAISDGKVKACRLHDVLLDFCKERAAEENFLLWIKRDQSTKAVYSHKQHAHLAFTDMDNLVEWILDLEHQVVIDFIPTELFYLRYLSAHIEQNSIPSSISNLWNLETLILNRRPAVRDNTLLLPSTIWDMVKLRHLHIPNFSPENEEALLKNSARLYDLETISTPFFSRVEDAELMLRKTPYL
ncbi:hypothetical protein H5410_055006 [Solanum commersonii]|uniref:Disease resistance protein winged helix domain-containing protein n=1 Tax=Solanum commersonii TaxID=4109 RepID=A0A9J5WIQ1_SOLCO|nr:hypothetical protein H5410_055006 [Solanum commersonii]